MIAALEEAGVGNDDFIKIGAKILHVWFKDQSDRVLPTRPGFVASIFRLVDACSDRLKEFNGKRNVSMEKLDRLLHPIVLAAIGKETAESINSSVGSHKVIEHAAAVSRLPKVTQAITQHPAIQLDYQNELGWTTLTRVLCPSSDLDESHLAVVSVLLPHPAVDVSIRDVHNKTCLDFCIDHLTDKTSNPDDALKIIKKIAHHHTITDRMVHEAFYKLIHKQASRNTGVKYAETIQAFVEHSNFNVTRCDKEGKTAMDLCLHKLKGSTELSIELQCTEIVCLHRTTTVWMLKDAFLAVIGIRNGDSDIKSKKSKTLIAIAENKEFDVNESLQDENTAGHLAAKENMPVLMEAICRRSDYHPNVKDVVGHTALYYVCQFFPPQIIIK